MADFPVKRPLRRTPINPQTYAPHKVSPKPAFTSPQPAQSYLKQVAMVVYEDPINRLSTLCTFTLFIILTTFLAFTANKLPPMLPLFYSLSWGEHQLISAPFFTIMPLIILISFLLNVFVSIKLYTANVLLVRLLFFCSTIIALLLSVTMLKIMTLVSA